MTTKSEHKGVKLEKVPLTEGLFVAERAENDDYDFFEQLDLFDPSFSRRGQQRLPLKRDGETAL